jgi:predicted ABC-type sugar transport system permease subunit
MSSPASNLVPNGAVMAFGGVSSVYQILITGMLVILAVSSDRLTHRSQT